MSAAIWSYNGGMSESESDSVSSSASRVTLDGYEPPRQLRESRAVLEPAFVASPLWLSPSLAGSSQEGRRREPRHSCPEYLLLQSSNGVTC